MLFCMVDLNGILRFLQKKGPPFPKGSLTGRAVGMTGKMD